MTPANYDDREPASALADGIGGDVSIGDLGYYGPECADVPDQKFLISQLRQDVEAKFSQWWHQFIDRVFSYS